MDPEVRPDDGDVRARTACTVMENFIVLEGLDGSGTTTQLRLADRRLNELGVPHFCTGEPTEGVVGSIVRAVLRKQLAVQPRTVALLFAADRTEHLWQEGSGIMSRLAKGELVVCDRYLFSSLAYQSLACDFDFVFALNSSFPLPGQLVFLNTPVALSQQRLALRAGDGRELYDEVEIQQAIISGYERSFSLFEHTSMRVHRLDGSRSPEEVFEKFWEILHSLPIVKG